ncbi:hypothetical protein BGZ97_005482 [Linnemannia gamsii]|uniref:Cas12f1-like TNB domain-containing protein n=1 Tax=Linnemannia gamsii TaxID=64522 RepID=A0A9P6QSW6_9FUNG|nr:hypothetical protein BGZ97_005482 [Linnemannia gamsii]
MQWEQPLRILDIGTLKANTSRALKKEVPHDADLQQNINRAITTCLSDISKLASRTKRGCQQIVGQYLENLSVDHLDKDDRTILSYLTPYFSVQEIEDAKKGTTPNTEDVSSDNKNNPEASTDDKNSPEAFFLSLLVAIYKARAPRKRIADAATAGERYNNPSVFLQSTAVQLATEFSSSKKKGLLPDSAPDQVNPDKTPAENFIILNRIVGRSWRLSPMSPRGRKFVSLSEDDLVRIFWRDVTLRKQLQSYAHPTLPFFTDPTRIPQGDVVGWLKNLAPGELINRLLTDIGGFTEDKRRKRKNWSRSAHRMSISDMTSHISNIRDKDFNSKDSYSSKGYALRGSIRTDGYRIQLLAFKLNELNRQLDEDKQPDPLTSTLGGTDHYLTEIRNVVRTAEDVQRIWGCDPKDIKIVGIDLGKAFVFGASVLLPSSASAIPTDREEKGPVVDVDVPLPTRFHNLAVSQKAVYQPTFKHRRWLEQRKEHAVEGTESISHKETNLPPLRGPDASITEYVKQSSVVESDLEAFYNNITLKKHQWDSKRARDREFKLLAKRLLVLVGGTPGAKRDSSNKVVIGIGLGDFSSNSRLSSLHTAFCKYFVQLARSLDYIVVGVNEFYTSKRCPVCHGFVGQVDIRQLYCPTCCTKMHRDIMAGHNMCNIIQGHLLHQKRPHYLQPYDKNGNYIWEIEDNTQSAESLSMSLASNVEPGVDRMEPAEEESGPGRRKRAAA